MSPGCDALDRRVHFVIDENMSVAGVIDTDMARARGADALRDEADYYPLKRIGTAEEVAKAILYLASPDAGFITGAALAIDGGATAGG